MLTQSALIQINYDQAAGAATGYQAVEIILPATESRRFQTGNPVRDWDNAIDAILLSSAYSLKTDPSVSRFLDQAECPWELYIERARVGHPFSYASYMRLKAVPDPDPEVAPAEPEEELTIGRD